MQRPRSSQSPYRVGSGPLRPPTSSAAADDAPVGALWGALRIAPAAGVVPARTGATGITGITGVTGVSEGGCAGL